MAMIVVIGLSLFGSKNLRECIDAKIDSPGRVWFILLFAIGIFAHVASLTEAIDGQSSNFVLVFSLFGTAIGVIGLVLFIIDWALQPRGASNALV